MNTQGIKSDLFAIDQLCRHVEKRDKYRLMLEQESFYRYWGRFLGEMDGLWIDEKSNYYEKCYIEGCRLIGAEHQRNGNFETAIRLYQNILQINLYEEEVAEQLLQCYCQIGDWKRMKQIYWDFKKRFKQEMGIETAVSIEKILEGRAEKE